MPSRYHPFEDGLWDDEKFDATETTHEAPFEERAFFGFLATNKRQRPSGIYRATDEQLSAGARLPLKRVRAYLLTLEIRGLIVRDGAWIFLPGYLKRQSKNERLLLGVESDIESCSSIKVLTSFSEKYPLYSRWSNDRLQTVGRRVNENVPSELPQNYHNTTSEPPPPPQDLPATVVAGSSRLTPESLQELFNASVPEAVPKAETLGDDRRKKASSALRQFPARSWWEETFAEYHASRFLCGIERSESHKNFQPDFDWLLSRGKANQVLNAVKVHDGKYRNQPRAPDVPKGTKQTMQAVAQFLGKPEDRPW